MKEAISDMLHSGAIQGQFRIWEYIYLLRIQENMYLLFFIWAYLNSRKNAMTIIKMVRFVSSVDITENTDFQLDPSVKIAIL